MTDLSKSSWLLVLCLALPIQAQADTPRDVTGASCEAPFEGSALSTEPVARGVTWTGLSTSRAKAGVIAIWNETTVAITRDDGRTFHKLSGRFAQIRDVVVGAGGSVFVLEGRTITIEFPRGHVSRVEVPHYDEDYGDDEFARLFVGAGTLVHASRAGLAFTRDYGASWQSKELPGGPDEVDLTIEADGSLYAKLTFYNCHSGDYYQLFRGSLEGPWSEVEGSVGWLGHDFGYDSTYDGDSVRIAKVEASGRQHVLEGVFSAEGLWPAAVVNNGRKDYAIFGGRLYRLTDKKAMLLAGDVPEQFVLLAADSCDRLLGLLDKRLVRWSASTGWRQLDVVSE